MPFFDRQNIFPAPENNIKLQEFGNQDADRSFQHGRDGSEQYATNKGAVICFLGDNHIASGVSNRLVTFKGFVEDLQFKLNIEYDDVADLASPVTPKYLKGYKFGYSLTFNVVAHTVNDAVSNISRYSELERILVYPFSGNTNLGSSNKDIRIPNAYIFLSNLINNGLLAVEDRYTDIRITNKFVRKHGLRAAVESIKMDPDLEMGVFEYNNKVYFKSFKITLEIPVTNDLFGHSFTDEQEQDRKYKMLIPYIKRTYSENNKSVVYFGHKKRKRYGGEIPDNQIDSKGFPFCVPYSANRINTSYAQAVRTYGNNKRIKFGICVNSGEITQNDNKYITLNYSTFDAFLESYSYDRLQKVKDAPNYKDLSSNRKDFLGSGQTSFKVSINVPSYSVVDAEANCMKINSLFRMCGTQKTEKFAGGPVKVLLGNLIKAVKKQKSNGKYNFSDIYANGLPLYVTSLNVTVDQESGYFENNGYFLPKLIKLDMEFIYNKNSAGLMIYDTNEENPQRKLYSSSDSPNWPFGVKYTNAD